MFTSEFEKIAKMKLTVVGAKVTGKRVLEAGKKALRSGEAKGAAVGGAMGAITPKKDEKDSRAVNAIRGAALGGGIVSGMEPSKSRSLRKTIGSAILADYAAKRLTHQKSDDKENK